MQLRAKIEFDILTFIGVYSIPPTNVNKDLIYFHCTTTGKILLKYF